MTNLPEMTPSANWRTSKALGRVALPYPSTHAYQKENVDGVRSAITDAFRDGALAERERIVAMLRGVDTENIATAAITMLCATEPETDDRLAARAVLHALADRIAAEGKDGDHAD